MLVSGELAYEHLVAPKKAIHVSEGAHCEAMNTPEAFAALSAGMHWGAKPLYHWYDAAKTEHFYSEDATSSWSPGPGFVYMGVVAYVAPAPLAGYVEPNPALARRPLHSYAIGAPKSDRLYTVTGGHGGPDHDALIAEGYSYRGVEGAVYSAPDDGMVPLWRLSYERMGDASHLLTTSAAERDAALAQPGWSLDGTIGYVYPP